MSSMSAIEKSAGAFARLAKFTPSKYARVVEHLLLVVPVH